MPTRGAGRRSSSSTTRRPRRRRRSWAATTSPGDPAPRLVAPRGLPLCRSTPTPRELLVYLFTVVRGRDGPETPDRLAERHRSCRRPDLARSPSHERARPLRRPPRLQRGSRTSRSCARRLVAVLEATGRTFEIVFVDDGSRDGSFEAMAAFAARGPAHPRPAALAQLRPPDGADGRRRPRPRAARGGDGRRPAGPARAAPRDAREGPRGVRGRLRASGRPGRRERLQACDGPPLLPPHAPLDERRDPGRHRRLPAHGTARRRGVPAPARTPPLHPRPDRLGRVPADRRPLRTPAARPRARRSTPLRQDGHASRSTGSRRSATSRCSSATWLGFAVSPSRSSTSSWCSSSRCSGSTCRATRR